MGKDSLLKSTTKKTTAKKKAPAKKAASAKKKTVKTKSPAKRKTATKTTPKKKVVAKKAVTKVAKKKSVPKTAPKIKPAVRKAGQAPAPKKKIDIKTLRFKKFETKAPETLYQPPQQQTAAVSVQPSFLAAYNPEDAARIRKLLFKQFSLEPVADAPAEPKPPEPEPEVPKLSETISFEPPTEEPPDPVKRAMKYTLLGFAALIAILIMASVSNRSNYYINATDGAVEIWQGTFAPLGSERILILPGAEAPAPIKETYSKDEAYPIAFRYYLNKADAMLEVPGMPNLEKIRSFLVQALAYATTVELRQAANERLNSIDLMLYVYKADIAVSKGTPEDLDKALEFLNKASQLKLSQEQLNLINQKVEAAKQLKSSISQEAAATPPPPPPTTSSAETK